MINHKKLSQILGSTFEEPLDKCPGCGRMELHKRCPAHLTSFYMSDVPFTPEIEKLYRSALIARLCSDEEFFKAIESAGNM